MVIFSFKVESELHGDLSEKMNMRVQSPLRVRQSDDAKAIRQ